MLFVFSVGPDGVEPSSCPYKEPALTIELRAVGLVSLNEVGGIRTLAVQIKSLLCCRYTTTSCEMWVSVSIDAASACQAPGIVLVKIK